MRSGMEFLNYRVVDLALRSGTEVSASIRGLPDKTRWRTGIGLGDVIHYRDEDYYVASVSAEMTLLPLGTDDGGDGQDENCILASSGSIYGVFRVSQGAGIDPALRDKLLLNQAPAILMPFLRAAITGMLALAGYGALPLPLINMAALAEDMPRKIVEASGQAG